MLRKRKACFIALVLMLNFFKCSLAQTTRASSTAKSSGQTTRDGKTTTTAPQRTESGQTTRDGRTTAAPQRTESGQTTRDGRTTAAPQRTESGQTRDGRTTTAASRKTDAGTQVSDTRQGDDLATTKKFQSQEDSAVTLTREEIRKVAGEALANAPRTKLNNLNNNQLGGVAESLARSKKPSLVNTVMDKLTKEKAMKLAVQMANSQTKLPRRLKATLMKDLKKKFSDMSTISKNYIKQLKPEMLKEVDKDDIKKMAKNKETFEAFSEELSKTRDLPDSKRKAIADGAKTLHGEPDNWDKDAVGKYGGFARPKDLDKVKPTAIKGALDQLAQNKGIKEANARKVISKLTERDGLGSPRNWNATTLKRLGALAKGLSTSVIKEMDPKALKDSVDELGKDDLPKNKAKAIMDKIVKLFPPETWSKEYLKKLGKLSKGISPKDLKKLNQEEVRGALPELSSASKNMTQEQKREIATKIEDPSEWNGDKAKEVGNLCYGKSSKKLEDIDAIVAAKLVASMTPEKEAPEAKNRVLKGKIFSLGNVNLTTAGAVMRAITLNGLKNTNVKRELGLDQPSIEKPSIDWGDPARAMQLIELFKKQEGEPDTWTQEEVSALAQCGLLTGLSNKDISSLKIFPLEELADESSKLLPTQRKAVVKSSKEREGIKEAKDFSKLTRPYIESMAGLVDEFTNEELENLPQDAAVQAFRQIGEYPNLGKKPKELVRSTLDTALRKMGRGSAKEITEDDVLDLCNLLCGLSTEQVAKIDAKVFNDTKDIFGERKCFGPDQLKVLAKRAIESIGRAENLDIDIVLDLGCIIEGFSTDDIRKIKDTVIQEAMDVIGERRLSPEQAKVVMEKATKRASRRRRNTDVSSKTGRELIGLGAALLGLKPEDIKTINNGTFDEAASTIGKINGFNQEQLEAWAAKAKQTWGSDPANFNEDQLLRLGSIAIGFSPDDLGKMALSNDDVIENMGSQKVKSAVAAGYTLSQLSSALSQIKTLKEKTIDKFSGDEVSNLNNFALAMTTEEMESIPKETFLNCVGSLGDINEWSEDQMKKLKQKTVEAHGRPVSEWSAAQLRESGSTIGGFTKAELQSLSGEYVSVITPEAIKSMPPSLFASFTKSQLEELDYNQAAAVTDKQMQALPEEMRDILRKKTGSITQGSSGTTQRYLMSPVFLAVILNTAVVINL